MIHFWSFAIHLFMVKLAIYEKHFHMTKLGGSSLISTASKKFPSLQRLPGQSIRQLIRSDSGLWTEIRIPSVGIQWDPSVGNSDTRDPNVSPQPGFRQDLYEVSSDSDRIRLSD